MTTSEPEKKSSFLDDLRLLFKVVRMGHQLSRKALPAYAAQALVEAVLPFVNIVFPAMILNELAGEHNLERLSSLVLLTVGLNLLLHLSRQGLLRLTELLSSELDLLLVAALSRKTMSMDYEHSENPRVLDKYEDFREARSFIPSRIESQMQLFGNIFKSLLQLCSSFGLGRV